MFKLRGRVQGFAIGAAVMAGVMLGVPALLPPHSPAVDANQMAAEFNVHITWQDTVECSVPDALGCFHEDTPDTIYVKTGLDKSEMRYVILHEIGHVSQYRLGLEFNECNADEFARSLGGYRNVGRDC
jgi:hypothetical protein